MMRLVLLAIVTAALTACASPDQCGYLGENLQLLDAVPSVPEMAEARRGETIQYIDGTEGIRIPVRVYGADGDQVPVIMLHGLQSHSGWFSQSAAFIASTGSPVYAMDRRGSGLSAQPRGDCKDFREMIADVGTVADHAKVVHGAERVHVLGHCFGAIPAAAFACAHPERVQSLILSTPAIHTLTSVTFGEAIEIFFSSLGGRACIAVPLDTTMFSDIKAYQDFTASDPLALRTATASLYMEVPRARGYVSRERDELTMPVLMAMAGNDRICDNDANRRLFETLPSSRNELLVYPDARHILEFSTDRERFFDDLKAWLEKTGRPDSAPANPVAGAESE